MKWEKTSKQPRLYLISAVILLVGLSASIWIYLTAETDTKSVLGYELSGGNAYLITPENSRKYVHDLKRMGGNAAVYADEFNRWFIGLWHGKSLAVTVGCIAIIISLGIFLIARTMPSDHDSDTHDTD